MSVKRTKQNDEDEELLHLTKLLSQIHKEYFSTSENSIIEILKNKKKIFTGISFYASNTTFKKKIEDYGGVLTDDITKCTYVLTHKTNKVNINTYELYKSVVLDEVYIFECIYRLKKLNVENYILYDFSGDEKLISELFIE
ncbi:hypothetical protein NCER_102403 [Vairimorpha ceranae BRL01]|uniref:BRCT domain-containing protein n=2 Tax=Vairimorpha ceranae TaxID=40302 RepID=C4VBY8_VAIC1|nr:hypothetical protein AAJ76_5300015928 [Vairimorpha ceranae]EEQ81264.1 hypothetical protein NCER_102403 [Vairimorpha ceranae BRL01]KAF5141415.1 hypothetical protein G9O61_00g004140 [Vairimorpha ceranae]KKO74653.1 hypothetical protein AAJ76_5300015928 [Vairimorpha ceranae]